MRCSPRAPEKQVHPYIIRLALSSCPIATVFVTSTLVTLLFWTILPDRFRVHESSDFSGFYEPVARSILNGSGISQGSGAPAIQWPPGYPLVLAGTFRLADLLRITEQTALSLSILVSSSLTSVFVFMLARLLWRPFPAFLSSLVWMTYPFALWLTKEPTSEIPFMVVFYGAVCLFGWTVVRQRYAWSFYFLVGLLVGLAMLIRPIAIGVGMILAATLWFVRPELRPRSRLFLIAMILLGNIAAILPWQVWVYTATGRVVMLSTNGVVALKDGLTFALKIKSLRLGVEVPQDVERLMQDVAARSSDLRTVGDVVSVMTEALRTRPLAVAKLFALKAERSWYATDSHRYETPSLLIQIPYLILGLCIGISVIIWKHEGVTRRMAIGMCLIVLYFWGMTTISTSTLRYMTPVMGMLFVLAPMPFLAMWTKSTRRS